jgi:hypothetical protein
VTVNVVTGTKAPTAYILGVSQTNNCPMLKVYKNTVYNIIKETVKLDPNLFYITDELDEGKPVSVLSIKESPMKFVFRNKATSWDLFDCRQTVFSPDFRMTSWTPVPTNSYLSFDDISKIFISWLNYHAKSYLTERDLIDVWNQFQFETNIFDLAQSSISNNSKFNIEDSESVSNSIDSLKKLIDDKYHLTEIQFKYINERLDYLSEATNRLGKFDWSNLFVSIMISIAINMGVDTNTGKEFFELIKIAFNDVKYIISK